jgi:sodium transport system ATP-binding protein
MSAAVIAAQGLTKRFGDFLAVDGLTLEVKAGEVYGLIGPNGAGKSTTLRLLSGLLQPTSGRATLAGIDVGRDPLAAKARLGFVSGSAGLYGRLTPRELLHFFGRLAGLPKGELEARTAAIAAAFEIEEILDRRSEKLSTGQKQRVGIARALLADPPALILDEPTAGLDVLASDSLRRHVIAARDKGRAILYTTHYLAEAELLCDRVGLMHRGRLLREGTPRELRAETSAESLERAFLEIVSATEAARA